MTMTSHSVQAHMNKGEIYVLLLYSLIYLVAELAKHDLSTQTKMSLAAA